MFAYLGYLYCPAKEWSMMGSVLSQIQVSWNMEYLEVVRKWSRWLPTWIYLNSIICNSLGMESSLLFFFLLFFLEMITPLSLADITWILWSFDWKALCGMKWGIGIVITEEYSWQAWMSIPGIGDWQARYVWASKWWVYGGWRPVDGKYHSRSGRTIRQSSK